MFVAVIKPIAFRAFFVIMVFFDLDINQIDIKTAFLYSFINQLVYIEIFKGSELEANCNMIYKLLKALYSPK